jgi:hypothetical protein
MGIFGSRFSKFEAKLPDVSGKVFAITGKSTQSRGSHTATIASACFDKEKTEI